MMLVSICFMVLLQQAAGESNITLSSLWTKHPSIQVEIINKHNDLRRMTDPTARNMLKMTWNERAAKNAENWARECKMKHSSPERRQISFTDCGENIFVSTHPKSWSEAIQSLYNEVKNFTYGIGRSRKNAKIGHYTQLVWATSHQLGCALAHCPQEIFSYYYVCHYCPSGNINSLKTPYKKGPPCDDCPHHCDNGLCTNPCMHVDNISNCAELVREQTCNTGYMKRKCRATCECPSAIN